VDVFYQGRNIHFFYVESSVFVRLGAAIHKENEGFAENTSENATK
jgi:hypothetical protein